MYAGECFFKNVQIMVGVQLTRPCLASKRWLHVCTVFAHPDPRLLWPYWYVIFTFKRVVCIRIQRRVQVRIW